LLLAGDYPCQLAAWLIGVSGGDVGLGDTEPDDRGGESSFTISKPECSNAAYRNRASPGIDWDLDEQ
jgi:hypothetical protein